MSLDQLTDTRITRAFDSLAKENRKGFVTFLTGGDPDFDTSLELICGLPQAGADVIEIGMPFSDPMADGPSIQASSQRALKNGMTLTKTLELVQKFRKNNDNTPIVLMGYYNPIYRYGAERFVHDATTSGVDGLIIVDLPPEEDKELCDPALAAGLHWIRLVTPSTDDNRIDSVLRNVSGFIYYISVLGVTGTRKAVANQVEVAIQRLKKHTNLPIAIGFGIRTPDDAKSVAQQADGIVVGSVIVDLIKENENSNNLASIVHSYVSDIASAVKTI